MSDAQIELLCPKCNIEVQPIRAAVNWFCPHCAWPFTPSEIERQLRAQKQRDGGNGESGGG